VFTGSNNNTSWTYPKQHMTWAEEPAERRGSQNVSVGSSASSWRCPRYVRFPPDSGRKADIPVRLGPPHQLRNRQSEPSFTLVLVESGSIPKAIEFVLNPPADVPPA
jgi:hypothetical protein